MNRLICRNKTSISIGLALAGFIFTVGAYGISPAPDGGYAGGNTAEGTSALFSLTTGIDNTGLGYQALFHETTSNYNTATGYRVLFSNTGGESEHSERRECAGQQHRRQFQYRHGSQCALP